MKNIFGMRMVDNPLMLKKSSLGGAIRTAQDHGRQIAGRISGQ